MLKWQNQTIQEFSNFLEPDLDVLALLVYGSCAGSSYDEWSDVDLLVVLKENALPHFFPTTTWLENFGSIFTHDQSQDSYKSVTRVCYQDFRRVDLVFTTEENLKRIEIWPRNLLDGQVRILFSHSVIIDNLADKIYEPKPLQTISDENFAEMVRDFRFKSMLSVYKVVRNDLLVSIHLALDLVRSCAVMGMLLRDRLTGSDFHKNDVVGFQFVRELQRTYHPITTSGILDMIEHCSLVFDSLAGEWAPGYQPSHPVMTHWIQDAKDVINKD